VKSTKCQREYPGPTKPATGSLSGKVSTNGAKEESVRLVNKDKGLSSQGEAGRVRRPRVQSTAYREKEEESDRKQQKSGSTVAILQKVVAQ